MEYILPNVIINEIIQIYWYNYFKKNIIMEIKNLNKQIKDIYNFMNLNFFCSEGRNDLINKNKFIYYNNLIKDIFNYSPYKKIIYFKNSSFYI